MTERDLTFVGRDGIPIAPLYTEPVEIDVPQRAGPWQIRPIVTSVEEAEEAIALGADSLWWRGGLDVPEGLARPMIDEATPVSDATGVSLNGGTELDELGWFHCVETVTDVAELRVAMGPDVFKGIAKLRALRVLWKERTGRNPFLHAIGSTRSLTRYDAHTNILRQTTQAFAAAAGGADAISLCRFDGASPEQGALARRLAITTQMILREEGMLDAVADPAHGSYYLDWLTREMVERTQRTTRDEWFARRRAAAPARSPILGVTEFPLAGETPLPPFVVEGMDLPFDSAPYEALRDHPAGPIYLCKLGTPREYGKQAAFARSLFITGGFTVVEGEGPGGFAESGATIACVVGPGDVEIPGATRIVRDLDPKMDKLAFLRELRG